ncbi:hypothetical protein BCR33DRAFT_716012 [Rhizoclosmatium globosum]|uniref:Response regulatory domain-containing protein n=1 Tax=Rhizoclosmatium globosum TaxID=329046 RepID=A0A1Y2CG29_9FUNG|nr:hypothetical protein BCR33DRAFT_716012 [Rhizoclosmatium globosum]|eukprot:ORY46000.1 hypothetical protein BCR33DRAFT_716012 [Rhizoclosmatium globosum]
MSSEPTPNVIEKGGARSESSALSVERVYGAVFMTQLVLSYGLVRLSQFMTFPNGTTLLWTANGLQLAVMVTIWSRSRLLASRFVVPLCFFVTVFLGLLSSFSSKTAALISLVHLIESSIISWFVFMVSNNSVPLKSLISLTSFIISIAVIVPISSTCRSLILLLNKETSLSLPNLVLLDWCATFAGNLIFAPMFMFHISPSYDDICSLSNGLPVLSAIFCLGIAYLFQYALPNNASLFIIFFQSPFLHISALYGGYVGLSFCSSLSLLSNLGFSFLSSLYTQPLILSISSGFIPVLYIHAIIHISCLISVFLCSRHHQQRHHQLQHSKEDIPSNVTSRKHFFDTDEMNSAEQQTIKTGEMISDEIFHQNNSKMKYMSLMFVQIHSPLITIMEACQIAKLQLDAEARKLLSPVLNSTAFVLSCVDDYLNFERLESGLMKPKLATVNLANILDLPVACAQKVFEKCNIMFEHKSNLMSEWALVDPTILQQILLNILLGPIDCFPESPEKLSLEIKYCVLSTSNDAEMTPLSSLEMAICVPNVSVSVDDVFTPFATKLDSPGNICTLTMPVAKLLIQKLGGELRSFVTKSGNWKITIEIPCQPTPAPISKHNYQSMTSDAAGTNHTASFLKTLAIMTRPEAKDPKDSSSLSNDSGELNSPTLFGVIASSLGIALKSEVFQKSSTLSLPKNEGFSVEGKSYKIRKSNASGLSSGISSLRRSLSSSKQFRKKVHYNDAANQMESSADGKNFEVIDKSLILEEGLRVFTSSDGNVEQISRRSSGISIRVPSLNSTKSPSNKSSRQGTMRGKSSLYQDAASKANSGDLMQVRESDPEEQNIDSDKLLHISLPSIRRNSYASAKRVSLAPSSRRPSITGGSLAGMDSPRIGEGDFGMYSFAIPELASRNLSLKSEASQVDVTITGEKVQQQDQLLLPQGPNDHLQGSILVVDDSAVFRHILVKFLKSISPIYSVSEAPNGEEALDLCRNFIFNIIFMDLDMPKGNGWETVSKLKAIKCLSPIVIITGNNIYNDDIAKLSSSVVEIVPKPLSKDMVLHLLTKYNKTITRATLYLEPKPSIILPAHQGTMQSVGSLSPSINNQVDFEPKKPATLEREKKVSENRTAALVVDDSITNRAILAKMLEKMEVFDDVAQVATGQDAIRLCGMKKFNIIFMDLEMPAMNGEETSARIRSAGIATPIVAVTGNIVRGNDESSLKVVGINQIMLKPITRQGVEDVCRKYVPEITQLPALMFSPTSNTSTNFPAQPRTMFGSLLRNKHTPN